MVRNMSAYSNKTKDNLIQAVGGRQQEPRLGDLGTPKEHRMDSFPWEGQGFQPRFLNKGVPQSLRESDLS